MNSIDDYEQFLGATLESWSPEQRLALAAAMAERWLPVYEAFSAREEWGDPASLRRSLEAVWNHLRGRRLARADLARHLEQLRDSTPHMDDFDDGAALAACVMLGEALECCRGADNVTPAMQAVLSGFEAVTLDWELDPDAQPRLWQRVAVRKELKKQLKLLEEIGAIAHFDDAIIAALRKNLARKEYAGEVARPSKPASGPTAITNQTAFEQYRHIVEADLRSSSDWWDAAFPPGSLNWVLSLFGVWMGRYTRRRDTINGSDGRLADVAAQQALVARQRAHDGAVTAIPDWDPDVREMIDFIFQNPFNGFDVTSPEQPHGYGPSVRALWAAARRLGKPAPEAWRHVLAWGHHRPAAWDAEDRRKKQGLAHTTPALGEFLGREVSWTTTGDVDYPWASEVEGQRWQIRLNDFPDDYMYSLVIDGTVVGDFHDWPETWQRG
ncbi:MAG TPA: DUF416 family protein [Ardenticatenaceae bacterium]|nr:DUF416 family protein [Ardenticatenaceae bacterium]